MRADKPTKVFSCDRPSARMVPRIIKNLVSVSVLVLIFVIYVINNLMTEIEQCTDTYFKFL